MKRLETKYLMAWSENGRVKDLHIKVLQTKNSVRASYFLDKEQLIKEFNDLMEMVE